MQATLNDVGRLTDGRVGNSYVVPTGTIEFIYAPNLHKEKKATYLRVVCDYRPQKDLPERVRWTVGGNNIDYEGDKSTPTFDMITANIIYNIKISTPGARFMGIDIEDF